MAKQIVDYWIHAVEYYTLVKKEHSIAICNIDLKKKKKDV